MDALAERPSIQELDQLSELVAALPLDRDELVEALGRVEEGLRERGRALDLSGGLLDEEEKAARMSLAREDDRLRYEISSLLRIVESIRRSAHEGDESELRGRMMAVLAGLRGHRDAEASLVLESADTEVGSGD